MSLTPRELLNIASQDFILGNTTPEEQVEFIRDQIKDPFNSGSSNYFKKLRSMITPNRLDEICVELLGNIEDRYPDIEFDLSEYDQHLEQMFTAIYKFFVKNIQRLMFTFIREYLYTSKNRKVLIADYLNTKLPSYPKEQYGKKEYYILITKLPNIISDIAEDDIRLEKFISYIERDESAPMYVSQVKELLDKGIICDHGVVENLFELYKKSDEYDQMLCKLQMRITQDIINPYLEENGLASMRIPPVEDIEEDISEDETEDTEE